VVERVHTYEVLAVGFVLYAQSLFDLEVHGLRPLKGTSTDIYRRVHDEHSVRLVVVCFCC